MAKVNTIRNFVNGTYRGKRLVMLDDKTTGGYEWFGEYEVEVVEPAKDGTPRIRINGGRARKVMGHSTGTCRFGSKELKIGSACYADAPDYEKRFVCDSVMISADPAFLIKGEIKCG